MVVRRAGLPARNVLAAAASFALVLPSADAATLTSVARQRHARSGNRLRRRRAEPEAEEEFGFSEDKAHRVGPGGCFNIWRNTQDHCLVKTKCADQNITDYSFSLVCKDKADGVVRHQFGKDSFDNEETFDTLIICKSCEPDAIEEKKLVFNLPVAGAKGSDGDVKKLTYDLPKANESAKTPSLEEQVKELTGEVKELKTDMELAEAAVEKLNAKVFTPGAPAPAPPAFAPAAAAPPAAPLNLRAHRKRQRRQPPVQHHRRKRVAEEQDDDQDDDDEDSTEVSSPPQPPAQAAVLASSSGDEEQQQQEDGDSDEDATPNSEQQQQSGTLRQACYMNLNELACEGECVWNKGRKACEEPNQDEDDVQQAQTVVMTSKDSEDSNSQDSGDAEEGSSQGSEDTEDEQDSTQESEPAASEATEAEPENPENEEE